MTWHMASASKHKWIITATLLSAVGLALVLLALRSRSGDLALRIRIIRAVNEGGGEPLEINNLAAFTWDSLLVLKPGTPGHLQAQLADVPWYTRWLVGLETRDDICLLAFKLKDNFRTHVVLERKAVDCLPAASNQPYSNDTAVFDVLKSGARFSFAPAKQASGG